MQSHSMTCCGWAAVRPISEGRLALKGDGQEDPRCQRRQSCPDLLTADQTWDALLQRDWRQQIAMVTMSELTKPHAGSNSSIIVS